MSTSNNSRSKFALGAAISLLLIVLCGFKSAMAAALLSATYATTFAFATKFFNDNASLLKQVRQQFTRNLMKGLETGWPLVALFVVANVLHHMFTHALIEAIDPPDVVRGVLMFLEWVAIAVHVIVLTYLLMARAAIGGGLHVSNYGKGFFK